MLVPLNFPVTGPSQSTHGVREKICMQSFNGVVLVQFDRNSLNESKTKMCPEHMLPLFHLLHKKRKKKT